MSAISHIDQDHLDAMIGKDYAWKVYFMGDSLDAPETLPAGSMYQGIVRRNFFGEVTSIVPYQSKMSRE